ncbi:hypothetical protein YPPY34_1527, partial [Yersinia pestis PY-34]
MVSIRSRVS